MWWSLITAPGGITRYEMAEWLAGHHHHLVCIECGAVEDIELPEGLELELERLVGQVSGLGLVLRWWAFPRGRWPLRQMPMSPAAS